jgi:hypothetical protein
MIPMRLVLSFLAPFLVSASLWAADPFLGYWRLDPQRSTFGHQMKALTGGIVFETDGAGYRFHEAIAFGEEKIARRYATVRFGEPPKRIGENMVIHTSNVNATTFEEVYADRWTAKPICTFRYTVYPQVETLVIVVMRGNETPLHTLVFAKR